MIDQLKIRHHGHPALRMKCHLIRNFTPLLSDISNKMFDLMKGIGIGLAAPQIGIPWQMFVVDLGKPKVFINPVIKPDLTRIAIHNEGCLSLPGFKLDIPRPRDIYIEYVDLLGKPHKAKYAGMYSRCIQHEYDHLKGKLITDFGNLQFPQYEPTEEEIKQLIFWDKHNDLEPHCNA